MNENEAAARLRRATDPKGPPVSGPGWMPVGTGRLILALSVVWSAIILTGVAMIMKMPAETFALLSPIYLWAGQAFEKYFATRNGKPSG